MVNNGLSAEDIALRTFMREYQKKDTRTLTQIGQDMRNGQLAFAEYWKEHGNGQPMPARLIKRDGTFVIFNSKEEKDAYFKEQNMKLMREAQGTAEAEQTYIRQRAGEIRV